MATIGTITIGMGVNTRDFAAGLQGAEARLVGFTRSAGAARGALASFAGGFALLAGAAVIGKATGAIYDMVKAGANLGATLSKTKIIFGDSAGVITGEADRMADRFGAVRTEFIDAAASFGAVFKGMGKTQDEAARLGVQIAKLGMDMASFEGGTKTNADAFVALQAALKGEFNPIESFRVFLSAAKIEQAALSSGLARGKGEITDYAKKMATLNLVIKQTADADKDLERTFGDADNQIKAVGGRFTNLKDQMGLTFKPVSEAVSRLANILLTELETAINRNKEGLTAWATEASRSGGTVFSAFAKVGKGLGVLLDIVHTLKLGFTGLQAEITVASANVIKQLMGFGIAADKFLRRRAGMAPKDFTEEEAFMKGLTEQAAAAEKGFFEALAVPPPSEGINEFFGRLERQASAAAAAAAAVGPAVKATGNEMSAAAVKVGELETKLRAEVAAFGKTSDALDIQKLKMAGATDAELKSVKGLAAQLEGLKLKEDTMKPLEKFQKEAARLKELREPGGIDFETYERGMQAARKDFDAAISSGHTHGAALTRGTQEAYAAEVRAVQGVPRDEPIKDVLKENQKQTARQDKMVVALNKLVGKGIGAALEVMGFPGT